MFSFQDYIGFIRKVISRFKGSQMAKIPLTGIWFCVSTDPSGNNLTLFGECDGCRIFREGRLEARKRPGRQKPLLEQMNVGSAKGPDAGRGFRRR